MLKHTLVLSTVLFAFDANASCMLDEPEIGDIGPSSELVCRELEKLFPGSTLAVDGRTIYSPDKVTVQVSVNREPVTLTYGLDGYVWRPAEDCGDTDKLMGADGLSMR